MYKSLWITCGIPGSGKTHWINEMVSILDENKYIVISRDQIRFNLLSDNDNYFDKEDFVFENFCQDIQTAIDNPQIFDIFIDATHLSRRSREKVLNNLDVPDEIDINIVYFNTPLEVCLDRNEKRKGRQYVPPTSIKQMYTSFHYPQPDEISKWNYSIFWISKDGELLSIRR